MDELAKSINIKVLEKLALKWQRLAGICRAGGTHGDHCNANTLLLCSRDLLELIDDKTK